MAFRNPNLLNVIKARRAQRADETVNRQGYSFDYWARQAKQAPPSKVKRAKRFMRRVLWLVLLLVAGIYISLHALEWQAQDLASLQCDQRFGQPSDNHLLSLGGCR